jgi:hypothetical protein
VIKFPPQTLIRTPMGRLATVLYYDSQDRVHVRYVGPDAVNANEQGEFPGRLLNQFSAVPEGRDRAEGQDRRPLPSTEVQHTCGKGDPALELKQFWANRTGRR